MSVQCSLHSTGGRMRGRREVENGAGSAELWSSGVVIISIHEVYAPTQTEALDLRGGKFAARTAPMSRSSPNSEPNLHTLCPRMENMRYLIAPRVPLDDVICALCTTHGLTWPE